MSNTRPPIRVVLVDDHPVIRGGIRYFLATTGDIAIVGEASSGIEAIQIVGQVEPHVVVMDLVMPDMDGISATRELHRRYPHVRVLALTSFIEDDQVQRVLEAGASGCLAKGIEGRELASAIRATHAGRHVLNEATTAALIRAVGQPARPGADLSERELEVLSLLVGGCSNDQIAARLLISRNTVRHHVQNILGKLGAQNRTEAVAIALQHAIIAAGIPA